MQVIRPYLVIVLTLLLCGEATEVYATHNRAGEIRFEQIGPLTIRAMIITYTRASSVDADRDSLRLYWGDGTYTVVLRTNGNGNGVILPNDVKYNIYTGVHTYPGRGTYTLSMTDPNRIGGILNVNPPNSIDVPFHIETTFTFLNPQFEGYNSSVILNQPPLDYACVGQQFVHFPNASDPDGDSIAYELIIPLSAPGLQVPNYSFPNQINPGPDNMISFNPVTGKFLWDSPQKAGIYNIAFYIKEYRNGNLITKTIRDMQIIVKNCDNRPPEFKILPYLCVIAGTRIEIPFTVTDSDIPMQKIRVQAYGGPVNKGAFLTIDSTYYEQPIHAKFVWETSCNDISEQYYSVVIKAVDNGIVSGDDGRDPQGLSTLQYVRIKIIGPPPEKDSIKVKQNHVVLSWQSPYDCEITEDEYFRGFTIWRRNGSSQAPVDTCNSDLEAMGYHAIAFNILSKENGRYTYTDGETEPGHTYCYRITGQFALTTPAGNPYNIVESLPSDELCILLNRDLPTIKNVSVITTDKSNGKIYLRWLKPDIEALDTVLNPGPYAFSIERSKGIGTSDFTPVPGSMSDFVSFKALTDTSFIDSAINTTETAYTYRVVLYTEGNKTMPYGYSPPASSVYLKIISTDRTNILQWDFNVPWYNYDYTILRFNPSVNAYVAIDSTDEETYADTGLNNGEWYCYLVKAEGSYGINTLNDTLINLSQESCGSPIDTLAPCTPEFTINNFCNLGESFNYDRLINEIIWEFTGPCTASPDIVAIRIYYAIDSSSEIRFIEEIPVEKGMYLHSSENGLRGCYYFTAVDSVGNESSLTDPICMINCPLYTLPNTFTPNGDGHNDIYGPISNRFIDKVEFIVYNRWGNRVFHTSNPMILWDGRSPSGKKVSPGTYFYICKVYEAGSKTQAIPILKGYIEIIY